MFGNGTRFMDSANAERMAKEAAPRLNEGGGLLFHPHSAHRNERGVPCMKRIPTSACWR